MAQPSLRVRRYVGPTIDDLALVDEHELANRAELHALLDADWAWAQTSAGRQWRIVIDDPEGDIPGRFTIEGHAAEWQDDRDQAHEDDRAALGWKAER